MRGTGRYIDPSVMTYLSTNTLFRSHHRPSRSELGDHDHCCGHHHHCCSQDIDAATSRRYSQTTHGDLSVFSGDSESPPPEVDKSFGILNLIKNIHKEAKNEPDRLEKQLLAQQESVRPSRQSVCGRTASFSRNIYGANGRVIRSQESEMKPMDRYPSRTNSYRMKPILLAPLARLDANSDASSSDFELDNNSQIMKLSQESKESRIEAQMSTNSRLRLQLPLQAQSFEYVNNEMPLEATTPSRSAVQMTVHQSGLVESGPLGIPKSHSKQSRVSIDDGNRRTDLPSPRPRRRFGSARRRQTPMKKQQEKKTKERIYIDWIFMAQLVDYVAFICCLFAISGVPVFLFWIVPPDEPDYNLDVVYTGL